MEVGEMVVGAGCLVWIPAFAGMTGEWGLVGDGGDGWGVGLSSAGSLA